MNKNELQAKAQWFLLMNDYVASAKDVTWDSVQSGCNHVKGEFLYKGVKYDILADVASDTFTPRIQNHNAPETLVSYAWGK